MNHALLLGLTLTLLPGAERTSMLGPYPLPGMCLRPVTRAWLIGDPLRDYGRPQVTWTFTETGFVVDGGGAALPADLALALLGPNRSATRIEGNWRLDEVKEILHFSGLRAGKGAGRVSASLGIGPGGVSIPREQVVDGNAGPVRPDRTVPAGLAPTARPDEQQVPLPDPAPSPRR
jgi:hypothetical protein